MGDPKNILPTWLASAAVAIAVLCSGGAVSALGAIIGTTGDVVEIAAPPSVVFNTLEGPGIPVFIERGQFTLPVDIPLNVMAPGTYGRGLGSYDNTVGLLAAGMVVDCYFVHFDPTSTGSPNGSITFSEDILGVIASDQNLEATDAILGAPGTLYPIGQTSRGLEDSADQFTLHSDRRTLTIDRFHSSFPGDTLRVLTLPEPATVGDLSWDPGNDGLGGVGNWNTTDLNWDDTPPPDTDANVAWTGGDNAVFETGSGVVTINEGGAIVGNTITFNSPGGAYTIDGAGAGDSLNLTGSTITADTDATINAKVTAANLSKLGTGALTLNDITGLEGGIYATAGTLTLGDPAGLPGGVTGVTFGPDSTLANSSGGLMDWTGKTITVNGNFRIGAGDAMKFDVIDPGADYRVISIDNAIEVSHFTGYHYGVVFGGAGTMTLTGEVGGSSFDRMVRITEDLTVVLNSPWEFMDRKRLILHDSATLRLDADDQLEPDRIDLYDSSTLDVNSRTETIGSVRLMSPDARIALTTGSLAIAAFSLGSVFGGVTLDTGTSGILTLEAGASSSHFNRSGDSDTVMIGGSGTVSHDGDSLWSVSNSFADIDLRVDAKITGDGATASGVLSFHSSGNGNSTVLLTNPTNDFNLRLNGAKVLLGSVGAEGTGEIEMVSGYLGAATGATLTLSKDIRITGSGGFTGDGDLTVNGRINTGASDRTMYFDNTGLVTLAGQIANFDDDTVCKLSFGGSRTVVLTNPANDYSLKVNGASVLLGTVGAGGTGEIEMYSGRLGAATGTNLTLGNDIKLTGSTGFGGGGNLTVAGRINTGNSYRTLTLDNTALVTVSGGIGNFDTADVPRLIFKGAGDLTVSTPGNPIHNATVWWDSSGTLTFIGPQQLAGDFRINGGSVELTGDQTVAGDFLVNNGGSMTINGAQQIGGVVSISEGVLTLNGGTLVSAGRVTIESTGQAVLNGTQVTAPTVQLDPGASVSGHGTVIGKISTSAGTTITADGGTLTLGDTGQFAAFNHQGELHAGTAAVVLKTQGFASLGPLTTLAGGTLSADNGVYVPGGANIEGYGLMAGRVAADFGSTIAATGNLTLGDSSNVAGFVSDGELYTDEHTVTLHDANQAVLGSLSQLGTDLADGTLVADNGLIVEFGKNIVGRGTVDTPDDELLPLTNNGVIIGDFFDAIKLTGYVKGVGTLTNVKIDGTLSPGFSPVRMHATNLGIGNGGKLVMELGGLSGGSEYDQLVVAGDLHLDGTLQVSLIDDFTPDIGDMFDILDFGSLDGTEFDAVELPGLVGRKAWDDSDLYSTGEIGVIAMLAGDTDIDWDVDDADYQTFVGVFGGAGDWHTDFNEDGRVDLIDFGILRANFGTGVGPGAPGDAGESTPEPATLILLAGGLPLLLKRKRKSR